MPQGELNSLFVSFLQNCLAQIHAILQESNERAINEQ